MHSISMETDEKIEEISLHIVVLYTEITEEMMQVSNDLPLWTVPAPFTQVVYHVNI